MIKVVVIGSGNVAHHLMKIISKTAGLDLIQVVVRNIKAVENDIEFNKITTDYSQIKVADAYIISVSDAAIREVSDKLLFENRLVVHTSGSCSTLYLNSKNRKGVFYPLQTFSKSKDVNFQNIPICLEAENESDFIVLEKIANLLSSKVFKINSDQRKALHIAAVFVNNFTNHLFKIGNDICIENNIPFEILTPLLHETISKLDFLSPKDAQTGPAKREDIATINSHLKFLSDENQKDIYKLLTKSIIDDAKKL